MSTHNICFHGKIKKNIIWIYAIISSYVSILVSHLRLSCTLIFTETVKLGLFTRVLVSSTISFSNSGFLIKHAP